MPVRWVLVMQRRLFLTALRDGVLLAHAAGLAGASVVSLGGGDKTVDGQQQLKLFFSGDVMTGRGIDQILPHPSDPVLYEEYVKDALRYVRLAERASGAIQTPVDYSYIWGDALDVWQAHKPDLRVVNLETSVTVSDDYWPAKGINYRMHPLNVPCLREAELDCCVLANNHVLDWGLMGLEETLTALHGAGLKTAGVGRDFEEASRPLRLSVAGKGDVLVFAAADVSSGVPPDWSASQNRSGVHLLEDLSVRTAAEISRRIVAEKLPGDVVVFSIHWGRNWGYEIPNEQRRFARHLIDSGAVDIVHGHSSHHAKAVECYRDKIIIYGCGDFVTDYEGIGGYEHFRSWLSPMYFVTLNPDSRQVERLEIEVMRMRRFRLEHASGEDRRWLRNKLNEYGAEFANFSESRDDTLVADPCTTIHQRGTDEYSHA